MHELRRGNNDVFRLKLDSFTEWLRFLPVSELTLSRVARKMLSIFALDYCCIHGCCRGGLWRNRSGLASRKNEDFPDSLRFTEDHPTGILELVEEQELGVRNFPIRANNETLGVLVVKGELPDAALALIANAIGRSVFHEQ